MKRLLGAIILFALIAWMVWSPPGTKQKAAAVGKSALAEAAENRAHAVAALKLDTGQLAKSRFGIMTATFTFTNPSDYDIKDIKVMCRHAAPSGTFIDSSVRTIYQVIPAHGRLVVRDFDMGFVNRQAVSSGCFVLTAVGDAYRPPWGAHAQATATPLPRPAPGR